MNETPAPKKKLSLKRNMLVFGIGVLFTKIINFVCSPIYSHYLTTAEFGVIDILSTTAFLLFPILTLCVTEAVIKYGIDDEGDPKKVFSCGAVVTMGALVLVAISVLVGSQFFYKDQLVPILVYYLVECLFLFLQAFAQSQKKTGIYAISSVLYSLFSVGTIIAFALSSVLSVNFYFYGLSIGVTISILFLIVTLKPWSFFSFKNIDKETMGRMLRYSTPLIASNIAYWVISGCDKYITWYILGEDYNGLLAVVHRIPTLCTLLYSVFHYAYALSALKDHQLKEETYEEDCAFYTKLFHRIVVVLTIGMGLITLLSQPIVALYASDYQSAWVFIPLYTFGVVLGLFRNFFISIYCTKEKTLTVMFVVVAGAIINALSCFLLMKFTDLGLWATAISTILANGFIFLFYLVHVGRYVRIRFYWKSVVNLLIASAVAALPCFSLDTWVYYVIAGPLFALVLAINVKDIITLTKDALPHRSNTVEQTNE